MLKRLTKTEPALPPIPVKLAEAETGLATATQAWHASLEGLNFVNSTAWGRQPPRPEEIAAASAAVNEAKAAVDAASKLRNKLRQEYEAEARDTLKQYLTDLDHDIRSAADHIFQRLAAARTLQAQARAAGINLGAPILAASDRLSGVADLVKRALTMVEPR